MTNDITAFQIFV